MRKCGLRVFYFAHLRISTDRERESGGGGRRGTERERVQSK